MRLEVSPLAALVFGLGCALDEQGLFLPFAAACAVHECAHCLLVRALGGRIRLLRIALPGAELVPEHLCPRRLFLCTLAGPAANLLSALLFRRWPRFAVLSLLLGLYNLLPLEGLDGGQLLRLALDSGRAVRVVQAALLGALSAAALLLCRRGSGLAPALLAALLLLRAGAGRAFSLQTGRARARIEKKPKNGELS